MAFTIVPLQQISLPQGTRIEFARDLVLQDIPDWIQKDKALDDLNHHDRERVLGAHHAFVAEYEATVMDQPDPLWQGKGARWIQSAKSEAAMLANLAIWLAHPVPTCFTQVLHGFGRTVFASGGRKPICCHPKDIGNSASISDLKTAAELHSVLCLIPRDNAVWTAIRAMWAGLTEISADIRYSLLWIGLEALFGAEDGVEIGYKLAQRIAFFLADNPEDGREFFRKVKKCYRVRSKIVHGRWKNDPDIDAAMADTEAILRTAFLHLIESPDMLNTFTSTHRDKFLEDWVFSRSTDPPPFPTV